MKVLVEEQLNDIEYLIEENEGKKSCFISGPFMVAEAVNGNGRLYNRPLIEREVQNYQQNINERRAIGSLDHPPTPSLHLENASHLITELKMNGNTANGKAKLLNTPKGKTARILLDDGVRFGVSSRGVGSLREENGQRIVQPDFKLITVDLVATPSAPGAYVDPIMENIEWIFDGIEWRKQEIIIESLNKSKSIYNKEEREELFLKRFKSFLSNL